MDDTKTSEKPEEGASSETPGTSQQVANSPTPQEMQTTYHETSIFEDFNDAPEIVAEEIKDFGSDSETTLDICTDSDGDSDGDEGNGADNVDQQAVACNSSELGSITNHIDQAVVPSLPLTGGRHNTTTSFASLLYSPHAPGRGSFDIEQSLRDQEAEVKHLETEKRRIKILLREGKERCRVTRQTLDHSKQAFKTLQDQHGIPAELWREYEVFCESLEPRFGCRGGWSVTCFANHRNSYVNHDPELTLFMESAELSLQSCNFRCEAYTVVPTPRQRLRADCPDIEYVVEFWPVASPVTRTGTETTWGEQYPNLYRLATQALYDLTRPDTQAASELLKSLPEATAPFSGGWLFEYQSEGSRAMHPMLSRRWMYRSAHKISGTGTYHEQEEEDPITDEEGAEEMDSDQEDEVAGEALSGIIDPDELLDIGLAMAMDLD